MCPPSSIALIDQTLAGDRQAFGTLVDQYKNLVYGLVLDRIDVRDQAEDLAQEAFIQAYKNLPSLRDKAQFSAWLGGIVRNLCNQRVAKREREKQVMESFSQIDMPSPPDPARQYDDREKRQFVHQAIQRLPERSRQVVRLHYLSGLSHQEIAAFLGIAPSTVLSHLHNGRAQLREQMLPLVEETLAADRLPRGFVLKVLAALSLLTLAETEARPVTWGLGAKGWIAGGLIVVAGLLGWQNLDEIGWLRKIHTDPPQRMLSIRLATPEQQARLDRILQQGIAGFGVQTGYGLISISGDPDKVLLISPTGDSLALGRIIQTGDLQRQAALAKKVGLAVLRLDWSAYPESRFSLAYGEQISLNGPELAKGAIIRTLHTAHIKALLIQADERIPYREIRDWGSVAREAGITLQIFGGLPHDYAPFDSTAYSAGFLRLREFLSENQVPRMIAEARESHARTRLFAPLFVLSPQPLAAQVRDLSLEIDQDGNMKLAGETVKFATLEEKMRTRAPDGVLRIQIDDQVPLGQLFQALDIAAKAGIRSIRNL